MLRMSVVMATRNRDCIFRCLRSLLKQTIRPYEIVVVDTSVTDKIKPRIEKMLKSSGIRLVYNHYTHNNLCTSRNKGIDNATGDILFFLDDDAVLDSRYVEEITSFLSSNRDAAGAEGFIVNEKNRRILERLAHFPRIPKRDELSQVWFLHGSNMTYRREIFNKFRFDENIPGFCIDDTEFGTRVSKEHKLYFVPTAIVEHNPAVKGGMRTKGMETSKDLYEHCMIRVRAYHYVFMKHLSFTEFIAFLFQNITFVLRILFFSKTNKYRAFKGVLAGYASLLR